MDSKVDWEIAFRIVFIGTIVQDYGSIWQTRSFCCAELIIYIILYIHVWYCCTDITYTYLYYSLIVISLYIHCISCICMVWYLVVLRCFWPLEWRRDTMRTLFGSPSCRGCSGFNPYIHSGCCKCCCHFPILMHHIDHHRFLHVARNELDLAAFDCSKPIGPEVQSCFVGLLWQVVANRSRDPCVPVTTRSHLLHSGDQTRLEVKNHPGNVILSSPLNQRPWSRHVRMRLDLEVRLVPTSMSMSPVVQRIPIRIVCSPCSNSCFFFNGSEVLTGLLDSNQGVVGP